MKLKGSCHCKAVTFELESQTPYPFEKCYCSICRKTAGGGGFAIHIMGDYKTLKITGKENITEYRGFIQNPEDEKPREGEGQKSFCKTCGSALWNYDPRWPEWIYPLASSIDTDLPKTNEHVHILTEFKADWVELPEASDKQKIFERYPDKGIFEWHEQRNLKE